MGNVITTYSVLLRHFYTFLYFSKPILRPALSEGTDHIRAAVQSRSRLLNHPGKKIKDCIQYQARPLSACRPCLTFGFRQCTVCLTNQLYLLCSHPQPGPGPPLCLLCASSQTWLCFDWDLSHLCLLNHVDARVTQAFSVGVCLSPNSYSQSLQLPFCCCSNRGK